MKYQAGIAVFGALLIPVTVSFARDKTSRSTTGLPTPERRPGRDAFMQDPSTNVTDLAKRLQRNPVLLHAYAKHFGVPSDRFLAFVKDALLLKHLTKPRDIVTYGRRRNGATYPVTQRLPVGTPVWVTRSGAVLLKWQCTNPIGRQLPIISPPPRSSKGKDDFSLAIDVPTNSLAFLPLPKSQDVDIRTPLLGQTIPPIVDTLILPILTPITVVQTATVPIEPEPISGSKTYPWLWALGITLPRQRSSVPVPEPTSVVLFILGGLISLAWRRKK